MPSYGTGADRIHSLPRASVASASGTSCQNPTRSQSTLNDGQVPGPPRRGVRWWLGHKPSLGMWGLTEATVPDRAVLRDKGDINFLVVVNYLTIGNLKEDGFILTCSLRVECPQQVEGEARWQEGRAATSSVESRER